MVRFSIPGFYDAVQKPTDDELKAWKQLPFNEEDYRKAESRLQCSHRRGWILSALSHLGASYSGSAWCHRRLPGAGSEDSDSGARLRQGLDASRAQPGRRRHLPEIFRLREEDHA